MRKAAWRQNSGQQIFLNIVCSTDVRARTLQPSLAEQNTAERIPILTSQFEMLHNFPRLNYWVSWADNWHRWRAAPAPGEESEERQWLGMTTQAPLATSPPWPPCHYGHLPTLAPCQINQLPGLSLPSPGRDAGLGWAGLVSSAHDETIHNNHHPHIMTNSSKSD